MPRLRRIHRVLSAVNHAPVKRVLHVRLRVSAIPTARCVLVSFSVNSSGGCPSQRELIGAQRSGARCRSRRRRRFARARRCSRSDPTTTYCETTASAADAAARLRARDFTRDADQNIVGVGLGVFDEDVEVAVLVEDAGVDQFEFRIAARAAAVFLEQLLVGKLGLRILVQALHVGMRRRGIEVEVTLLHVLAVVALIAGEAEQALFENRIAAVPERQRETQALVVVADAGDAVFAPAVRAQVGMLERENNPRRFRRRCSPRGPCPMRARKDTDPSAASACSRRAGFDQAPLFSIHELLILSVYGGTGDLVACHPDLYSTSWPCAG